MHKRRYKKLAMLHMYNSLAERIVYYYYYYYYYYLFFTLGSNDPEG